MVNNYTRAMGVYWAVGVNQVAARSQMQLVRKGRLCPRPGSPVLPAASPASGSRRPNGDDNALGGTRVPIKSFFSTTMGSYKSRE